MFSPLKGEVHKVVRAGVSDEFGWGRCLAKSGCTRGIFLSLHPSDSLWLGRDESLRGGSSRSDGAVSCFGNEAAQVAV